MKREILRKHGLVEKFVINSPVKKCFVLEIDFCDFSELKTLKNLLRHHRHYCTLEVTLLVVSLEF